MALIDPEATVSFSDQFRLLDDRTINVDPNGDIILAVHQDDDESKTFRVSSQVMRLASSHWRKMLDVNLGFQEATMTGTISLREDNIQAVFLVLLASHLKFQDIPENLTFVELYELCVTCDKYFCVGVIRPWIYGWMSPWKSQAVNAQWARIVWVLGDQDEAFRTANHLIKTCKTNEAKQCLNRSEEVIDDILPPGLPDAILKARYTTLVALIESCHSLVYNYEFSGDGSLCKGNDNKDECDALIYGHLLRQLQKLEIADTMKTGSVEKLLSDIQSITSYTYPPYTSIHHDYYHYDRAPSQHVNCGCAAQLHNQAENLVFEVGSELVESNRKQLETRWKELEGSKMDLGKFQS